MSELRQQPGARPTAARRPLLVFHKLQNSFSFGVTNYRPDRFAVLLRHLNESGWPCVAINSDDARRGRGIVVTFDDGYDHLAEFLPELMASLGLRPLIFMPTTLMGRPNSWDYSHCLSPARHLNQAEVRNLARLGATFGSHGASHCDLTACSSRQLQRELVDSRRKLQDITGQSIDYVSYPFGRCDRRVAAAVEEAGYKSGFTMTFPRLGESPYTCGRYPVYGFDTLWSVRQKLERGRTYSIERFKSQTIGRLSGGTVLLNTLRDRNR